MNAPPPPATAMLTLGLSILASALTGCVTAPQHREAVQHDAGDRLTVGTVQKDIHLGMSGAEIIGVLGAPNIVATDEQRREVWTYDRMASDVVYSFGGVSVNPLIFASGGSTLGGATGGFSQSAGASSRSQRTLTVVISFDEQKRVRDFAYHATSF